MKSFKQFINESEALSLNYGNSSVHFSKQAAVNRAKKLHASGHKNVTIEVKHHPSIGTIHIVDHEGKGKINEMGAGGAGGGGAVAAGPTNVVSGGAIAGTGGKGGEPGVDLRKKRKRHDPRMMGMGKRKDF